MKTAHDLLLALRPDEAQPTPLYLQLARNLESAIHAGQWKAEEALPSERNLSETLNISRVTARKALEVLFEQGLIRRNQGSGTFITPRLEQPLSRLSSFSEMLRLKGFTPGSTWLERGIALPTHDELIRLGLSPTEKVARMKRLRKADGTVMAIENSTLPARLLPDPTAVGDSLYEYLDGIGRPVVRALQHVRAINASASDAALVGIAPGTAMLLMTRIGYLEDNTPIELTDTEPPCSKATFSPRKAGSSAAYTSRTGVSSGSKASPAIRPATPIRTCCQASSTCMCTAAAAATSWKAATPSPPSPAPTGASARPRCWPPP